MSIATIIKQEIVWENWPIRNDRSSNPVTGSVLNWDFSVLRNTARFDADSLGTAVVPKTDGAVLYVPAGIDPPARLTHEA